MSERLILPTASKIGLTPFYEQLLQFSLFQGLSRTELQQMVGNTRFGFQKLPAGRQIVGEGDTCTQLYFLVKGALEVETVGDDHTYRMIEQLQAPLQLQPEALFGMSPRYSHTFRTCTDCQFIVLSKDEVLRLFDEIFIFRLNYINILAAQSQQQGHRAWRRAPQTLDERVARFFIDHCMYPAGHKELHILMRQLAIEVGDSRLDVSRVLNGMEQRGLLELHRGLIVIPSLEQLFM